MRSDLIIFQRNCLHPSIFDAIHYFQGMGKPVVIDLDDAYQILPWSNPARDFWHERDFPTPAGEVVKGGAMQMLEEGIRISAGLLCPNRLLLNSWGHIAKNLYYLQNYAEPRWWLGVPEDKAPNRTYRWRRFPDGSPTAFLSHKEIKQLKGLDPNRIIIGWGGSISHYDSFWGSGILKAATRLSNRHPELFWMICGNDRRIFDHLDVSPYQKEHQPGVPPSLWPQVCTAFDIGVAPLTGIYDQHRSWIKGIEYSLAGIPWVATEGETYGDLKDWPCGVQGPETADFWEQALEEIIKDLPRKQEEAESMVGEARQRFIVDNQLHTFGAVFDRIINDFRIDTQGLPGMMYVEVKDEQKAIKTEPTPA